MTENRDGVFYEKVVAHISTPFFDVPFYHVYRAKEDGFCRTVFVYG